MIEIYCTLYRVRYSLDTLISLATSLKHLYYHCRLVKLYRPCSIACLDDQLFHHLVNTHVMPTTNQFKNRDKFIIIQNK